MIQACATAMALDPKSLEARKRNICALLRNKDFKYASNAKYEWMITGRKDEELYQVGQLHLGHQRSSTKSQFLRQLCKLDNSHHSLQTYAVQTRYEMTVLPYKTNLITCQLWFEWPQPHTTTRTRPGV